MLYQRVLSGVLFLPFFYLFAWKLPPVYFLGLVLAAAALGQHEFYRMARERGFHPNPILGLLLGSLVILDLYRPMAPSAGPYFVIVFSVFAVLLARLFSRRPVDGALEDVASTLLGLFYVAVMFAFLALIRAGSYGHGRAWLVFLFLVIWASDIGAYSVGVPFGRRRLYEKISPKKSIEGLGGAVAASIAVALLCRVWFMPPMGVIEAAALGAVLAVVGTLGDLTESLLKRAAGIKDSGTLIPGHGGILDRMDSMLFAAPVLYYYIRLR